VPSTLRRMTPQQRRVLWVTAAGASVAFFVVLLATLHPTVTALDLATRDAVRAGRHPLLQVPMNTLNRLGSGDVQLPLGALVCAMTWRRHRRLAGTVVVVSLATVAGVAALKWLIGKPRPKLSAYGFPSGHVVGTLVFFGVLLYLLWVFAVPRRWQVLAAISGALMTFGVAYGRLYVNAHWLTDVMGGMTAGIAATTLAWLYMDAQLGDKPGVAPG
jgi:membrane-associated phospholipid phosphatase